MFEGGSSPRNACRTPRPLPSGSTHPTTPPPVSGSPRAAQDRRRAEQTKDCRGRTTPTPASNRCSERGLRPRRGASAAGEAPQAEHHTRVSPHAVSASVSSSVRSSARPRLIRIDQLPPRSRKQRRSQRAASRERSGERPCPGCPCESRKRALKLHLQVRSSEIVPGLVGHIGVEGADHDTVAAPPPRPAMADVARDRAQPTVGPARVPKHVTMTPRLEQRLLRQILRDRMIARDGRAEPNQPPALRLPPTLPRPASRSRSHIARGARGPTPFFDG